MNALVSGATGLIGKKLVQRIDGRVHALSRERARGEDALAAASSGGRVSVFEWDAKGPLPDAALEGVDTVFHLAGEPVAEGRWNDEKKRGIRESRIESTRAIVDAIARHRANERAEKPRVLVSASAVGIYGDRGNEVLNEQSAAGQGFLADVCREWEAEARRAEESGVRVVMVRIGIVLAREGGALAKMLPLFKAGVAGPLASGKQWMPWLHVDDVVGLFLHAATSESLRGPMNACAPEPATNADFTKTLGKVVHRPAFMPVPRLALRAVFGETANVVLASQRVVPERALASGYRFAHANLREALEAA
jgi:uncharacterized protein